MREVGRVEEDWRTVSVLVCSFRGVATFRMMSWPISYLILKAFYKIYHLRYFFVSELNQKKLKV